MAKDKNSDVYFAVKPADETASIVLGKADSFYNMLRSNTHLDKLNRMYRAYYGIYNDSSVTSHSVNFTGEQGELVTLPVNHFRNLAQHMKNMITATRPVMEARAANTDYESLAQTVLANGILDYYMREKHLEDAIQNATEMAIVLGAGFIKLEWNAMSGEATDVDPETGELIYEGEVEFSVYSPFDVVVDGTKESWNHDWILVRSFQNRHNLIAKYPELTDKIKSLNSKSHSSIYRLAIFSNDETDDVPVYEFFHKKTEALPEGRYLFFADPEAIFIDTKLPYPNIPVYRVAPNETMGTPYGYSPMFDVFPIQEAINALYSTIMTNQNAFGVQNVWLPEGSNISVENLTGALNVIKSQVKPESLNLTDTPAEIFKSLELMIQSAETISGVNSVARGNPEASLKSGTALALVQSMALQFMSGLQQNYVKLIEDVGTALINILKMYATTPKVVALVGKHNRPLLKKFTGDDVNKINRVIVDMGNPLSRTTAGRVQMAEQMLQMKLLKNPEQYFQVVNTGRLDAAYEGDMSDLLLIKLENEMMLEGEDPIVSPIDRHAIHIIEHRAVINDPDLRKNPALVKIVMDHIEEHVNALETTKPQLLQLIGEQPLTPPETPPSPGGPEGTPVVPAASLENSPMPEMMSPVQGQVTAGTQIEGPGVENIATPAIPKPPPPFEELPVQASDLTPR